MQNTTNSQIFSSENISQTAEKESSYDDKMHKQSINAEHLKGLQAHFQHRNLWSNWLLRIIVFMVAFQSVLLILVGIEFLDFKEYDWLLPTVMTQYLLQIVGLATYAVKELFRKIDYGT